MSSEEIDQSVQTKPIGWVRVREWGISWEVLGWNNWWVPVVVSVCMCLSLSFSLSVFVYVRVWVWSPVLLQKTGEIIALIRRKDPKMRVKWKPKTKWRCIQWHWGNEVDWRPRNFRRKAIQAKFFNLTLSLSLSFPFSLSSQEKGSRPDPLVT